MSFSELYESELSNGRWENSPKPAQHQEGEPDTSVACSPSSVFSWEASHPHLLPLSSQNFLTLDLHGDPRESYPHTPMVIDGVVLPKTPEELQAERRLHTVPYMVGFKKKEFGCFLPTLMGYPLSEGKLNQKTAMSLLWKSYPFVHIPKELIPEAIEKYLGGTDDPVKKKDLFLDLMGDVLFGVPSVIVAGTTKEHASTGPEKGLCRTFLH
ncbi:liver carboxylesterase 1-like [Pongo abelii]|uniref:liver carboxylesterase 1-like n=1 Tax=Pongo abelii TaxID=9601 RepID=UPI003006BDF7